MCLMTLTFCFVLFLVLELHLLLFCVLQIHTWMKCLLRGFRIITIDCFCNSFKFIAKVSHLLEFVELVYSFDLWGS